MAIGERDNPKRILLADDDIMICDLFTLFLKKDHPEVEIITCLTGESTIEQLKCDPTFDLLLIDQNMPDGTGADVYQFVKESGITTPFILISTDNISDHHEFNDLMEHNSNNDYLQKPINKDQFKQLVSKYL
jgi:two-component system, OmpR family, response regulator MprA